MNWALDVERRQPAVGDVERESLDLALLALFAPGNVAWRAVGRLLGDGDTITTDGRWHAVLTIATGLRTLFQRPESVLVVEQVMASDGSDDSYWRQVLAYCAAGDLQAVLDEYLHHLRSEKPSGPLDDETLLQLATSAADVLSLRTVTLRAFDPHAPADPITMRCRFALRYGAREGTGTDQVRASEVRAAFNSPFWPFVMATTSAGQEGIDFQWWCSAVIHWNTAEQPRRLRAARGARAPLWWPCRTAKRRRRPPRRRPGVERHTPLASGLRRRAGRLQGPRRVLALLGLPRCS